MTLLKKFKQNIIKNYPCVTVLSVQSMIDQADLELLGDVYTENERNKLVVALALNSKDPHNGQNWTRLNQTIDSTAELIELPFFARRYRRDDKILSALSSTHHHNPFLYMFPREQQQYYQLASSIVEKLDDVKMLVTPQSLKNIDSWLVHSK